MPIPSRAVEEECLTKQTARDEEEAWEAPNARNMFYNIDMKLIESQNIDRQHVGTTVARATPLHGRGERGREEVAHNVAGLCDHGSHLNLLLRRLKFALDSIDLCKILR